MRISDWSSDVCSSDLMWSEHCSYKSSRLHLKKLPTEAPWVICGPGENAGVIDIGDGPNGVKQAAIFKMESHNHPSYIEPYQGAATGVGGILRDVRSEEHTSELKSLMRISYAVFCLKKKTHENTKIRVQ